MLMVAQSGEIKASGSYRFLNGKGIEVNQIIDLQIEIQ
jgi:hypothetical protein